MRKRLVQQGWAIAVGGAAAVFAECAEAAPAVSAALVQATARNAHIFLFGTAAAKATLGTKIISLAEGVLYAMIVNRWKVVASLLVLLAITLFGGSLASSFVPGLIGTASAATVLFDEFNDGSLFDGKPVSWQAEGGATLQIQNESLIVSGGGVPFASPLIAALQDVSILVRARVLEGNAVGVAGRRRNNAAIRNYYVYVEHRDTPNGPVNEAGISLGGDLDVIQTLNSTQIPFDPRLEDFNLQLDIFGNQIRYWVWLPNQPRPIVPLGTAVDNTLTSAGGVFVFAVENELRTSRGAFRYIHVATTPIPIPEPTANSLAAAGGGVLAIALLFGRRRFRHKLNE
jgi:hypothetical protein